MDFLSKKSSKILKESSENNMDDVSTEYSIIILASKNNILYKSLSSACLNHPQDKQSF